MSRAIGRVRRSAEDWRAVMSEQKGSGLSRLAFCRREGIPATTFDKWRRRLVTMSPAPKFVDLTPKVVSSTSAGWDVEVSLPSGVVLRFRG